MDEFEEIFRQALVPFLEQIDINIAEEGLEDTPEIHIAQLNEMLELMEETIETDLLRRMMRVLFEWEIENQQKLIILTSPQLT